MILYKSFIWYQKKVKERHNHPLEDIFINEVLKTNSYNIRGPTLKQRANTRKIKMKGTRKDQKRSPRVVLKQPLLYSLFFIFFYGYLSLFSSIPYTKDSFPSPFKESKTEALSLLSCNSNPPCLFAQLVSQLQLPTSLFFQTIPKPTPKKPFTALLLLSFV